MGSQAETMTNTSRAETISDTPRTETMSDTPRAETMSDTPQAETKSDTLRAETISDTPQAETKSDTSRTETMSDTSQAVTKTDTPQAETKSDTSRAETMSDTPQAETMSDTLRAETMSDKSQTETKSDISQMETTTAMSTYTTSGMKRIPLYHDSPKATHYNSEFQQFISEVGTLLAESVETSALKQFLQNFSHILYPEAQYIDPKILKDAESIPQIFFTLQPQVINFLNCGVVWKAVDAFGIEIRSAFQSYKSRFPPCTPLSILPDPLPEEEISKFEGFQKLQVTCGGGSEIELTLGDVQAVREAVEKATGIDQNFINYAYWEGGFTTHQFTFLIPKSIFRIFGELCEEDLTILARKGVQRLEVEYDAVADNIQELYSGLPQAVASVRGDSRLRTKGFGLEHFIPEDVVESMSEKEFSYFNELLTSIPTGKLQETCSNDFLKKFAKKMKSWKDLASYFGINQWDLVDLEEMYPGNKNEQKYVALLNWKTINGGSAATYERLVEGLLTQGHVDNAKEVLLHLKGQKQ